MKKLSNSECTFNGADAIDHLSEIIKEQYSKMKKKRGRKRKVPLKISYHPPSINV